MLSHSGLSSLVTRFIPNSLYVNAVRPCCTVLFITGALTPEALQGVHACAGRRSVEHIHVNAISCPHIRLITDTK